MPTSPEEMQAQMDTEATEQEKKLKQQAFDAALEHLMPLSPEQVRAVYEKFKISRRGRRNAGHRP